MEDATLPPTLSILAAGNFASPKNRPKPANHPEGNEGSDQGEQGDVITRSPTYRLQTFRGTFAEGWSSHRDHTSKTATEHEPWVTPKRSLRDNRRDEWCCGVKVPDARHDGHQSSHCMLWTWAIWATNTSSSGDKRAKSARTNSESPCFIIQIRVS